MKTWTVATDVRGEFCHSIYGRITYDFAAGDVTPKNEGEEFILANVLGPQGYAAPAAKSPRKQEDR